MLWDYKSQWFQAYCHAVLEGDPETLRNSIRDAFIAINERLRAPDLSETEREAICAATSYLTLILKVELAKTA